MNQLNIFKIKYAEPKHSKGIIEVYKDWDEFKGILPEELISSNSEKDILKHIEDSNSSKKYVIAESKDELVIGVCYIDLAFKDLKTIRLGDMIVKKEFRRKGIGSALVDKIINFAKRHNILKIWLWTQDILTPAIKLYEKKGFIKEGRQSSQFCGRDAELYGLVLNDLNTVSPMSFRNS